MTEEDGSSNGERGVDELLRTLSHPVRREIIRYFEKQPAGTTASLEELVAQIKSRRSTEPRDVLFKTLYHVHLPKLQSRGWVEFDTESELVSYYGHETAEELIGNIYDIFTK